MLTLSKILIMKTVPNAFYEYLLMISLSDEDTKAIGRIKWQYRERYGCSKAANLKAHITMANFCQFGINEPSIINLFHRFCQSFLPVEVNLKGFGHFTNKTIYINVHKQASIIEIVKGLKTKMKGKLKVINSLKPKFITKSLHVTIARDMTEKQYQQAWQEWQNEAFDSQFLVKDITLLRRQIDITTWSRIGSYKEVARFPLEGKNLYGHQMVMPFLF
jgi:2'-5' RNA ligase